MKASVFSVSGDPSGEVGVPTLFSLPPRPDLVKRAFWILNSHGFQAYGRDPLAGERTTAESGNPPTGRGISRIPRVKGDRSPRAGMAGGVASVVKGRLPHPPRSEKVIYRKMNKKERQLALLHAIAATGNPDLVSGRGHKTSKITIPVVLDDEAEAISKTSEVRSLLLKIGLDEELDRLYNGVKRNSGKPRMRGRAYIEKVGPLIVVTNDRGIGKAASAIPGLDVVTLENLSVLNLAPGGNAGRLTIWTASAAAALDTKGKILN